MSTVKIHNTETGEVIERAMNNDELAQWQIDQAKGIAEKAADDAKAQAKAELLSRLGITEAEAQLLLNP